MINNMISITFYFLTLFVSEYLHTNRLELAPKEMDTSEELEQSILSGSTIQSDKSIDKQAGIRSRTARKQLNCLGYKWEKVQKGVFLNRHERKNVLKYRKTFLSEIKSLLPYFVEFFDNGSILSKAYFDNCAIERSDQRPIIMITHNESKFFTNNGC